MSRFTLILVLVLNFPLNAQAPVRYRYTTSPTVSNTAFVKDTMTGNSKMVPVRAGRATSLVSLASHDSAGGSVWKMTVDSTMNDWMILDSVLAARTPAPPVPSPSTVPMIHQVFMRDGRPISTNCCGPLDSLNPSASLLARWPGVGLLIPNNRLPIRVGETRTDTLVTHTTTAYRADTTRTVPTTGQVVIMHGTAASESYDTTITKWKRTATDTVDASVVRVTIHIVASAAAPAGGRGSPAATSTRTDVTGSYRVVYDAKQIIREVKASLATSISSLGGGQLPQIGSLQNFALLRIP